MEETVTIHMLSFAGIIFGAWAAGMGGAFFLFSRYFNKLKAMNKIIEK